MNDLETSRVVKLDKLYESLLSIASPSLKDVPSLWYSEEDEMDLDMEEVEEAQMRSDLLNLLITQYFETRSGDVENYDSPLFLESEGIECGAVNECSKYGFRDPELINRAKKWYLRWKYTNELIIILV